MTKDWRYTGTIGILLFLLVALLTENAMAEVADADVIEVRATKNSNENWTFHVTVSHPDTGWDNYCDGWDVITDAGEVLKRNSKDPFTRLLLHPHENEQPFTRSQSGLTIPDGVRSVTVRAHDIVDGFGGQEVILDLTTDSGPGYTISH